MKSFSSFCLLYKSYQGWCWWIKYICKLCLSSPGPHGSVSSESRSVTCDLCLHLERSFCLCPMCAQEKKVLFCPWWAAEWATVGGWGVATGKAALHSCQSALRNSHYCGWEKHVWDWCLELWGFVVNVGGWWWRWRLVTFAFRKEMFCRILE